MSDERDLSLWDIRDVDGRPRFYPPGDAHPAAAKHREVLRELEARGLGDHELAVYHRDWLLGIASLTGTVYADDPEGSRGLACWRCGRLFGVLRPDGEFVAHNPERKAVG